MGKEMQSTIIEHRFAKLEGYARYWTQAGIGGWLFPDSERMTVSRARKIGRDILELLEIAKHGERRARVRGGAQ